MVGFHISKMTEIENAIEGIVNRLSLMQGDDPSFDKNMDYHKGSLVYRDEPEIDEKLDCRTLCINKK